MASANTNILNNNVILEHLRSYSQEELDELYRTLQTEKLFKKADVTFDSCLTEIRFADGAECPHCHEKLKIKKKGFSKSGAQRCLCKNCGHSFQASTNTIFASSKIPAFQGSSNHRENLYRLSSS